MICPSSFSQPPFDGNGGGAPVDGGKQSDGLQHPAALRPDLQVVLVLVGDVHGEALNGDACFGAEGAGQADGGLGGLWCFGFHPCTLSPFGDKSQGTWLSAAEGR